MERHIFSVTEVNELVKLLLDNEPMLSGICVRGEISNYKMYPSGHHYFSLKDPTGAIRCVMFKGQALRLRFRPENGMKVLVTGRVSVFPRDGAYQLYCDTMTPEGAGDLALAFEQLKEQLYKEGLFDEAHKKPLPRFPERIAVVTSSAGAAVHDMIRILRRRYPLAKVILLPVRVQGAEAPPEIAGAIRYADKWKIGDVIITGRGGGSMEDLWAFNEECVARAIYREMTKRGSDFVYLDVTHKDPDAVRSHFPNIYEKCRSIGIDITKDWIPVTPAAHYCCGGVKVDTNGETSVKRLYALGETSCTGLHGANRLASNSLIEAVVYADQAARHTASLLEKVDFQEGIPDWDFEGTQHTEEMLMIIQSKREMQTIMSNYVGIVRSNLSLKRAMHRLEILWQETEELYNKTKPNRELCELRNMIAIAYLVIKQGREIKESVGCHYNADYPKE